MQKSYRAYYLDRSPFLQRAVCIELWMHLGVFLSTQARRFRFISSHYVMCVFFNPDSQFAIHGYTLYTNDRKKGGGGILVYISTLLPCRRLRISRTYKTLEPLAVEIRFCTFDRYRRLPPTQIGVR